MIKRIQLLIIFSFVLQPIFGQTSFQTLWGGTQHDYIITVLTTDSAGYFFAGHTYSYGAGNKDVFLAELDANGDTLWTSIFGFSGNELVVSAINSTDGGFVVLGVANSLNSTTPHTFLIKIKNGVVEWCHFYAFSDMAEPVSLTSSPDGGYLISGNALDAYNSNNNISFLKTDSIGVTEWIKCSGSNENDYAGSIRYTNDGGFVVAGSTSGFGSTSYDLMLAKYDSLGTFNWMKLYSESTYNYTQLVYPTNNGGFIIGGSHHSNVSNTVDAYLVKTNDVGDTIWTKSYGSIEHEMIYDLLPTNDNGFLLVGALASTISDDIIVMKTDSVGNIVWTKTYGGAYMSVAKSITVGADQGLLIGGHTKFSSTGFWEGYLIKTDSLGVSSCNYQDIFPDPGYSTSFIVTNQIPATFSEVPGSLDTIFNFTNTIAVTDYCTAIGLPDQYNQLFIEVIPNPANEYFIVDLKLNLKGRLQIFNTQGQKVYSKEIDEKTITVNSSGFSTGVYYIFIYSNDIVNYSKLVITR